MELERLAAIWLVGTSLWTFGLFGFDKRCARSGDRRVAEATLLWNAAMGGWIGGLCGILLFRHKSSKPSFLLKFTGAFVLWAALVFAAARGLGLV